MQVKQKVMKDDARIYSGKGWVSNGHWLYPVGAVTLNRKDLQILIDTAIPFVWTKGIKHGEIETGSDANVPDFEGVLPADFRSRNGDPEVLPFMVAHSGRSLVPVSIDSGVAFFDASYVTPLVKAGATIHPDPDSPDKMSAVVQFPNDERGMIMPICIHGGCEDLMEKVRTFLAGLAKQDG